MLYHCRGKKGQIQGKILRETRQQRYICITDQILNPKSFSKPCDKVDFWHGENSNALGICCELVSC